MIQVPYVGRARDLGACAGGRARSTRRPTRNACARALALDPIGRCICTPVEKRERVREEGSKGRKRERERARGCSVCGKEQLQTPAGRQTDGRKIDNSATNGAGEGEERKKERTPSRESRLVWSGRERERKKAAGVELRKQTYTTLFFVLLQTITALSPNSISLARPRHADSDLLA